MIQVYTGNGKGKTTAAFGLALRASGAGLNVYIGQFTKGRCCGEHKALKMIKNIKLEQYGRACFIRTKPTQADIESARQGWEKVKKIAAGGSYQVIILDEINIALKFKLLPLKEVLDFISLIPKNVELVLTGRDAPAQLIQAADLVSQIKEVKHCYRQGVKARKGIEL